MFWPPFLDQHIPLRQSVVLTIDFQAATGPLAMGRRCFGNKHNSFWLFVLFWKVYWFFILLLGAVSILGS